METRGTLTEKCPATEEDGGFASVEKALWYSRRFEFGHAVLCLVGYLEACQIVLSGDCRVFGMCVCYYSQPAIRADRH